ncbi:proteasome activator pa28, REG alpha/beta subunit [Phlegmacium glaucopus]|nr:proteasome activator pa28, REG alpha/beta subunit [Phlegmacium glaucopus]
MIQAAPNPSSPSGFHSSHIFKPSDFSAPLSNHPNVSFESPSKKRKIAHHGNEVEDSTLPVAFTSESTHVRLHEAIKKECEELVELIDQAKLWITLSLSNISSPDASEIYAQEDILAELHRAQDAALNLRNIARDDHLSRAKICSKLLKYPSITDYKHALHEYDEGKLYIARHHLQDIRNIYVALTALIRRAFPKEF